MQKHFPKFPKQFPKAIPKYSVWSLMPFRNFADRCIIFISNPKHFGATARLFGNQNYLCNSIRVNILIFLGITNYGEILFRLWSEADLGLLQHQRWSAL